MWSNELTPLSNHCGAAATARQRPREPVEPPSGLSHADKSDWWSIRWRTNLFIYFYFIFCVFFGIHDSSTLCLPMGNIRVPGMGYSLPSARIPHSHTYCLKTSWESFNSSSPSARIPHSHPHRLKTLWKAFNSSSPSLRIPHAHSSRLESLWTPFISPASHTAQHQSVQPPVSPAPGSPALAICFALFAHV